MHPCRAARSRSRRYPRRAPSTPSRPNTGVDVASMGQRANQLRSPFFCSHFFLPYDNTCTATSRRIRHLLHNCIDQRARALAVGNRFELTSCIQRTCSSPDSRRPHLNCLNHFESARALVFHLLDGFRRLTRQGLRNRFQGARTNSHAPNVILKGRQVRGAQVSSKD